MRHWLSHCHLDQGRCAEGQGPLDAARDWLAQALPLCAAVYCPGVPQYIACNPQKFVNCPNTAYSNCTEWLVLREQVRRRQGALLPPAPVCAPGLMGCRLCWSHALQMHMYTSCT